MSILDQCIESADCTAEFDELPMVNYSTWGEHHVARPSDEVRVLRQDDRLRGAGGLEDLVIRSIAQSQLSERNRVHAEA